MKKSLIAIAFASAVLAGCNSENAPTNEAAASTSQEANKAAISRVFGTYTHRATDVEAVIKDDLVRLDFPARNDNVSKIMAEGEPSIESDGDATVLIYPTNDVHPIRVKVIDDDTIEIMSTGVFHR